IDDEKNIRTTLRLFLEQSGAHVVEAHSANSAKVALLRQPFDLAFVDLRLGEDNGLELIAPLLQASPLVDVVVITAYGTVENAVEAIQLGARDVLQKPFSPGQIAEIVDRISQRRQVEHQLKHLKAQLENLTPEIDLESRSPRLRQLFGML